MAYDETPKYGFETPQPNQLDDVPTDMAKVALQVEELLDGFPVADLGTAGAGDEGKLLVVQNTGAAAWKALSGDATIDAAGALVIGNLKVGAAKIAAEAVEAAKIAIGAVVESKLATDSVVTAKLKDLAVTAAKLAADAVETAKIKDANVTAAKLANLAVETAKVKDEAITTAKIANGAISTAKLEDGAVTRDKTDPQFIQSVRTTPTERGAASIASINVVWPEEFADTDYAVNVTPFVTKEFADNNFMTNLAVWVFEKTKEKARIKVVNNTAAAVTVGFDVTAVHD